MSAIRIACVSIMLAAAAASARAADTGRGPEAARECVAIDDASARLACYDEALGRVTAPATAVTVSGGASAAATAVPASAEVARAVDEFGLTETAKRKRDPEKARETMPDSISATVAQVSFRPTGEVVVTLDNEQVWVQAEAVTISVRVKAGDAVTIRKAALGSYTLLTPSRSSIRVRRVH